MRMSSSLVNKNSFKMADVRPVECERKIGQNSIFKTKDTHTIVVPGSAVSRGLMQDHQGSNQVTGMQKHTPKKSASAGFLPSPPSTPSSRGTRNNVFQNVRTARVHSELQDHEQSHHVLPSAVARPSSALSAYVPLPSIGHSENDTGIAAGVQSLGLNESNRLTQSPNSDSGVHLMRTQENKEINPSAEIFPETRTKRAASLSSEGSNTRKISRRELRSQQFARRRNSQKSLSIADEPPEGEERFLIAVKLPEGERLQRYFRPSDSVTDIVSYVEQTARRSFSDCNIFTSDVPKRIISNLSVTISDAGLQNRTLLYLEEKDE